MSSGKFNDCSTVAGSANDLDVGFVLRRAVRISKLASATWPVQSGSDTSIVLLELAMMAELCQGLSQMLRGWRRFVAFPCGSFNLVESGYCYKCRMLCLEPARVQSPKMLAAV